MLLLAFMLKSILMEISLSLLQYGERVQKGIAHWDKIMMYQLPIAC